MSYSIPLSDFPGSVQSTILELAATEGTFSVQCFSGTLCFAEGEVTLDGVPVEIPSSAYTTMAKKVTHDAMFVKTPTKPRCVVTGILSRIGFRF